LTPTLIVGDGLKMVCLVHVMLLLKMLTCQLKGHCSMVVQVFLIEFVLLMFDAIWS
jgi:hypothetical protein